MKYQIKRIISQFLKNNPCKNCIKGGWIVPIQPDRGLSLSAGWGPPHLPQNNLLMELSRIRLSIILLLGLLTLLTGCESQPTEVQDYTPQPMLTAFLYNGEPVEEVLLERVGSIYGYYTPSNYGISGANIELRRVDNPMLGDTLHFEESANPGHYHPKLGESLIPMGQGTYRIEARDSSDLYLWAETTIPNAFSVDSINYPVSNDTLDTVLTRYDANIAMTWTPSPPIGGYVVTVACLDTNFIPLDPNFNPEENGILEDSTRWSFDLVLPEYNQMEVAWILFEYQGWYRLELQAVDPAYFEYFFSIFRVWQGAMTSLEYNVNGGLGIVAGIARHRYTVYVAKAP